MQRKYFQVGRTKISKYYISILVYKLTLLEPIVKKLKESTTCPPTIDLVMFILPNLSRERKPLISLKSSDASFTVS